MKKIFFVLLSVFIFCSLIQGQTDIAQNISANKTPSLFKIFYGNKPFLRPIVQPQKPTPVSTASYAVYPNAAAAPTPTAGRVTHFFNEETYAFEFKDELGDTYPSSPVFNLAVDVPDHDLGQSGLLNDGSTIQTIYGTKQFFNVQIETSLTLADGVSVTFSNGGTITNATSLTLGGTVNGAFTLKNSSNVTKFSIDSSGNATAVGTLGGSNFSGSHSGTSSGTNTGDVYSYGPDGPPPSPSAYDDELNGPTLSGWTDLSDAGITTSFYKGTLSVTLPVNKAFIIQRTLPSGDFTVYLKLQWKGIPTGGGGEGNYSSAGLFFSDSATSTGNQFNYGPVANGGYNQAAYRLTNLGYISNFINPIGFSATADKYEIWLYVQRSNTSYTAGYSFTGSKPFTSTSFTPTAAPTFFGINLSNGTETPVTLQWDIEWIRYFPDANTPGSHLRYAY